MDSVLEGALNAVKDTLADALQEENQWSPKVPDDLADSMPNIHGRFPLTLPWSKPKPVDPKEDGVWIFDNTAFRIPATQDAAFESSKNVADPSPISHRTTGKKPLPTPSWQVEYVAAYFAKREATDHSDVVNFISKEVGRAEGNTAAYTIKNRLKPFVIPVLPRHTIRINIGNVEEQTLGPSSSSGISSSIHPLHFTTDPDTKIVTTSADAPFEEWILSGNTFFAEPTGWGLISDIDDTIKITQTPSITGVLKTTFIEDPPRPVPGMPELYAHINESLDPAFFYLSASPYNLYPFLRTFRQSHFPDGSLILRDASWQNLAGLISSFRVGTQEYKVDRMKKIHSWFPERTFICLGDSTQKDPESYGEIARLFPGWIKAIFIRRVEDISEVTDVNQHEKNMPERFERAFDGLDSDMWQVFDEPDEVSARIDQLVE